MDEEELLLEAPSTFDVSNLSELDESAILGDDDIQEEGSIKDEILEQHEEAEELDYDEDLEAEKAPRSSKFTSERVEPIGLEKDSSSASQVQSVNSTKKGTTRAPKVFINPHHRSVIRPQGSAPHTLPLPWEAAVRIPNVPGLRQPVALPLPNSVTILPRVPHSVPFPIVPSSSTDFSRPPPQIMPLPNYSTPPPSVYPNQFVAESLGLIPSVGQWDQMVEGFLRRTTARSRSRFSRSPRSSSSSRSRSRSYSSHSSSSTISSRSSSRSPYRRVHSHSRRSSSRRSSNYRSRNEVIRHRPADRLRQTGDGRRESVYHSDRARNRANDVAKQEKTIECAKAIGLDSEYLTKLEEQKKMREVILRKKEERRIQTVQRLGGPISLSDQKSVRQLSRTGNSGERRVERSRRMDEEHSSRRKFDSRTRKTSGIRNGRKEPVSGTSIDVSRETASSGRLETLVPAERAVPTNSNIIQKMEPPAAGNETSVEKATAGVTAATATATSIRRSKRENEQNPERSRKKKAYLAVIVNSLNQAPISVDRIRIIAETVGPTKKVWRSSENAVSLIFEEHESAKKFMFHYHNRVIHGVQLAVTLQKLFANLTELP
uniref:RRM domain-containing protein n=1 Tax=Elaeophora elaphi TaxID=1147741 RepID=A0A0R3S5R0_9BILA